MRFSSGTPQSRMDAGWLYLEENNGIALRKSNSLLRQWHRQKPKLASLRAKEMMKALDLRR